MAFNLHKHLTKKAGSLSNGQATFDVPNGQGPGMGDGVQLTTGNESENNSNEIKDIIGELLYEIREGNNNPERISFIASKLNNVELPSEFAGQDDLVRSIMALGRRANEDPTKPSINFDTGEREQSIEELITSIVNMAGWNIEELINSARKQENPDSSIGVPPIRTSAKKTSVENLEDEEFKEEQKEDPAKKRKKGNPFKVLMGLVGKMLDHGMSRREIVKKVMKQEGNKWKQETVEKCIKVVMKARKKEKAQSQEDKKAMNSFNLYRYAQSKPSDRKVDKFDGRKSIYDIPRDIKLMSTIELISRFAYLSGANNFEAGMFNENNPGNKEFNGKQLTKDLSQVKDELSRRNYNDEQIKALSMTVQGVQPEENEEV